MRKGYVRTRRYVRIGYVRKGYVRSGHVRRVMWVLLPKLYVREEIPRKCVRTMEDVEGGTYVESTYVKGKYVGGST